MSYAAQSTGNPVFRALDASDAWGRSMARSETMTVQGTAVKTLILTGVLMLTAAWSWSAVSDRQSAIPLMVGSGIIGLITALITCFKPAIAMYTAPIYAAAEGVLLGAISHIFNARYEGIVVNAAALTIMTLFVMLVIYSNRWVRVTDKLRTGIFAATGAIMLVYLASMVMRMFGYQMPMIHDAGAVGIAFSAFVVGLAAFNLLLDFDFIERGGEAGLPKSMEWYGAFGLLVTLVWLYLEILRLLAKLQRK